MKAAIFGATGPIGRLLTRELLDRGVEVRAVSRSPDRLSRDFGALAVERHPADVEDLAAAREAAQGCQLVVHAVGLPADRFDRHVPLAENAVAAARAAGARALLITSYWSYGAGDPEPMPESRRRTGGGPKAAVRERQERAFLAAGGAVARLPDYYGPEPGLSLLNEALEAVRRGDRADWPGDPDAPRDFSYYPDAGELVARLALHEGAFGQAWNIPGSGPETPRVILARAAALRGTTLRLRRIRPWMARLAGLFRSDVRPLVDVIQLYEAPAILDTSKLEGLLGGMPPTTSYEVAIPETLRWLDERAAATREPAAAAREAGSPDAD